MSLTTPTVRYWIDSQDNVVRVNEEWAKFAADNDGGTVAGAAEILGRPLWSFIEDASLRYLYQEMVILARKGSPISFTFRCDSPRFRRAFRMQITGEKGGVVEFASTLTSEEAREAVSLLDCHQPRNDQFIRMCSWCKRVEVDLVWTQVEAAVIKLGLMTAPTVPSITHGICDDCLGEAMGSIFMGEGAPRSS